MVQKHTATFYAQVEPVWGSWRNPDTGERNVQSIKVVGITQKRPERPRSGTVVVKLSLRIPDAVFLPLRPEAVIDIPDHLTQVVPIEVEAADPGRPYYADDETDE